jgi:hypothetical protein
MAWDESMFEADRDGSRNTAGIGMLADQVDGTSG